MTTPRPNTRIAHRLASLSLGLALLAGSLSGCDSSGVSLDDGGLEFDGAFSYDGSLPFPDGGDAGVDATTMRDAAVDTGVAMVEASPDVATTPVDSGAPDTGTAEDTGVSCSSGEAACDG